MSEDILIAQDGGIVTVTFNRPGKRNAVRLAMWRALERAFVDLRDDAAIRAVILTGSGEHFCAGADISEFGEVRSDVGSGRVYEAATEAATIAIRDFPRPTIAAVSGFGVGGGCGLALACDFRVGDRTTRMGIPAARLGIVYSPLDCGLLHRQVGLASAKRVLFSGRYFPADECLRMGLLDTLADVALEGARDLAAEFVGGAPLSLKGSKVILEALDANAVVERRAEIDGLIDGAMASEDFREGSRAFLEKRAPVFSGR